MFHFLSSYITLCSTRHQINNSPTYPILSQPEQVRAVCRLCVPCSRCLPRIVSTLPCVCLFHDVSSPLALSVTPLPLYCLLLALSAFPSILFVVLPLRLLFASVLCFPFSSFPLSLISIRWFLFSTVFCILPLKATLNFHFSSFQLLSLSMLQSSAPFLFSFNYSLPLFLLVLILIPISLSLHFNLFLGCSARRISSHSSRFIFRPCY